MMYKFFTLLLLFMVYQSSIYAETVKLNKIGGTYSVPVTINDSIKLDFVIDSGAADVAIPFDVFSTLRRTGAIDPKDLLEEKKYEMANGDTEKYYTFNIRKLKIGNQYIYNISAAASQHMKGGLLLGQSALKKLEPWKLDTSRNIMHIKENKPLHKKNVLELTQGEKDEIEIRFENTSSIKMKETFNKMKIKCDNNMFKWCNHIGGLYQFGESLAQGFKADNKKAVKFYQKACSGGYAEACSSLAHMYETGKGVRKNALKAFNLEKKACNGGDYVACHYVGLEYAFSKLIKEDNYRAVSLFKKSCNGGYMMGCSALGSMYMDGKGIEKDEFKAVKLFKKACNSEKSGYTEGCVYLALMYYSGNGVRQSTIKAKEFFGRACDGGDSYGCKMYSKLNK